ncbi:hypothetical protein DFH09DRAFT_1330916 [Mycena vulgaris]|nr:hypothetical protein DFH09DRAFT_1330916 [Mycena vulgaris]
MFRHWTRSGGPGATASRAPPPLPPTLAPTAPSTSSPQPSPSTTQSPRQGLGGGSPPPWAAYGFLSPARDAVLGLPDALALDGRRAAVAPPVHAFLANVRRGRRRVRGKL